jgi:hypothetical protein
MMLGMEFVFGGVPSLNVHRIGNKMQTKSEMQANRNGLEPMKNMDRKSIDWYDFLRNRVNSFIKWDLVRFFHHNPHTRDTAENIAQYMGRDLHVVERELNELVKVRVLQTDIITGTNVYCLSDDTETRRLINAFMEACQDRDFRVKAISHVIRGMQFSPRNDF